MDPEYVRRRLEVRTDDVHRSLLLEYGETPERERTVETGGRFPETAADLFPWATVTLLTDPAVERVCLVRSEAPEYDWEPPGGRGDPEEAAETTARRGAVEAAGLDPRIEAMVLLERLELDYGREDGLTAPTVQAVFHGVVSDPGAVPPSRGELEARWFDRDSLPERTRFRETIARLLAGDDAGGSATTDRQDGGTR